MIGLADSVKVKSIFVQSVGIDTAPSLSLASISIDVSVDPPAAFPAILPVIKAFTEFAVKLTLPPMFSVTLVAAKTDISIKLTTIINALIQENNFTFKLITFFLLFILG